MPDHEQAEKPAVQHVRVGLPGGTVHDFELPLDATLSDVASRIVEAEQLDEHAVRIRLISSGKLFTDFSLPVREIVGDGDFLHCAVSQRPNEADEPQEGSENEGEPRLPDGNLVFEAIDTYRGVSVIIPEQSALASDRLREAGFSAEETRLILRHFHILQRHARRGRPSVGDIEEGGQPADTDLDDNGDLITRVRRPRAEPRSVLTSGVEGTNADFLMGCIFGYLLGIIVLVLLLDNSATRRWRVGLIAGVATNCAFGVLRTSLRLNSSFSAT
ncbi:Ubiquitin-like protein [Gracilaria domingensis]|nr:Ubiquitin-like protein [Gracilaria domingensis]